MIGGRTFSTLALNNAQTNLAQATRPLAREQRGDDPGNRRTNGDFARTPVYPSSCRFGDGYNQRYSRRVRRSPVHLVDIGLLCFSFCRHVGDSRIRNHDLELCLHHKLRERYRERDP